MEIEAIVCLACLVLLVLALVVAFFAGAIVVTLDAILAAIGPWGILFSILAIVVVAGQIAHLRGKKHSAASAAQ